MKKTICSFTPVWRGFVWAVTLSVSLMLLTACEHDPTSLAADQRPLPSQLPAEQRQSLRKLPIAGADNFRDLGGYTAGEGRITKWGLLYRADDLSELTAQDQRYLQRLAIKQVVDFRSDEEKTEEPDQLGTNSDIEIVAMPIAVAAAEVNLLAEKIKAGELSAEESRSFLMSANRDFVVKHTSVYREWLHALLNPKNLPAVFHCTAGKDRTGLAAAVLLLTLGVDHDTVMQDYLASNHYTAEATRRMLLFIKVASLFQTDTDAIKPILIVAPEYIEAAFQAIEENYGSFENYLRTGLDIDPEEQQKLIELLTEPQSGQVKAA